MKRGGVIALAGMAGMMLWAQGAGAKFGTNGIVTASLGAPSGNRYCVVMQPDGKLVVGGSGNSQFALARFAGNGTLDTSFGTNGIAGTSIGTTSLIYALAVQPDGKLVAAGRTWNGLRDDFALARFTASGELDTTFGTNGCVTTSFGSLDHARTTSMILQPDGKLVVAGWTGYISGSHYDFALARYTAAGVLDTTFGAGGRVTTSFGTTLTSQAKGLVLQPDGKLVAAGHMENGNFCIALARYTPDGALDTTFGTGGLVTTSIAGANCIATNVMVQPNGKLVTVGQSYDNYFALARYHNNGTLDAGFGVGGIVSTPVGGGNSCAYDLVAQMDGKVVAAGGSWNGSGNGYDFSMACYTESGALDAGFGTGGIFFITVGSQDDSVTGLVRQPDGKLAAAGCGMNGGEYRLALARCNPNGTLDTQADTPVMLEINPDHALAGQSITLEIRGWNLDEIIAVQLRNAGGSINGTGLAWADTTRMTAQFTLPSAAGVYDLYLAKNTLNRTFKSAFASQTGLTQPVVWQVEDLGKIGNPISGACGLDVSDADGDGMKEIHVANSDDRLYILQKGTAWSVTATAQTSGYFQDVRADDADLDGLPELYSANSFPRVYRHQWSGTAWTGNSLCAFSGPLSGGGLLGGALACVYALSGANLMQFNLWGWSWCAAAIGQGGAELKCTVVGDADNNRWNEVYAAAADHTLLKFGWGSVWSGPETVYSGSTDITGLAIGDLDRDGKNELYSGSLDGNVCQFTWNGSYWTRRILNTAALAANKITIGDADNDGQDELYAAGQDGHAYRIKPQGSDWQTTDLGAAGSALLALAVGDGDNSRAAQVYAVSGDGHVHRFQALSASTPVVTPAPTASPLSEDFKIHRSRINPARGEQAQLRWVQPRSGAVTITVFNLLGDKIATLADGKECAAGTQQELTWSGCDASGRPVGSGIYVVLLQAPGYEARGKVAVVK